MNPHKPAKLVSLLNMVGGLVGPSIGKVVAECASITHRPSEQASTTMR